MRRRRRPRARVIRAPPPGASSISTEPPWARDQAVDDVHAQPGAAAGAVLPELREHPAADRPGLIPSPSSSTCSSTPSYGASSRSGVAVSVTWPSPCRIALSTRLVTTWANLSGSALTCGSSPSTSKRDLAAGAGPHRRDHPVDGGPKSTGAGRATAGRCRCGPRRAARRSAGSSRSASALTVSSISFFWSSLSLSHLDSSVATKPLTPVSGERSSWATVATRSERSRSSRSRAAGRAQRRPRPGRTGLRRPGADDAGR